MTSPPPFDSSDELIADWLDKQLAGNVEGQKQTTSVDWERTKQVLEQIIAEHKAEGWMLSDEERKALRAGFDGRGSARWNSVVAVLKSGQASPSFLSAVADLIAFGGFTNRADLSAAAARIRAKDDPLDSSVTEVFEMLVEAYPLADKGDISRRAVSVAALLDGHRVPKVRAARRRMSRNRSRGRLADLRIRLFGSETGRL